jgi:hypothetical protein
MSSYTSPKNSRRGCLCADGKRYSKDCCKGKLINQGIGTLKGQSNFFVGYFNAIMTTGSAFGVYGYNADYPQFGSISYKFLNNSDYEISALNFNPLSSNLLIDFKNPNLPIFNKLIVNGNSFKLSEATQSNPNPNETRLVWGFTDQPFDSEVGIYVEIKGI